MAVDAYEIEIKCLLGSKEAADQLVKVLSERDPETKKLGDKKQLNHYFEGGNLPDLYKEVATHLTPADQKTLNDLVPTAKQFSLRTRLNNGKPFLILKISIDDTSSDNGTARLEFEAPLKNLAFEELDQLVLKAGFAYQAKWSRAKTDYQFKDTVVTISFSPGYGYMAEFEQLINDPSKADQAKAYLRQVMAEVGADELPQERLGRMFAYYNQNWRDYYGTDKVFEIL